MKKKLDFQKLRTISLYVLSGAALIALLFAGVLNKAYSSNTDLTSLDVNDTRISTDKLTELYVVADLSNALNLASAGDVAYNYVATSSLYEIGQASIGTGKLEKNITTDTSNFSRGVISYVVSEGETMEDIADLIAKIFQFPPARYFSLEFRTFHVINPSLFTKLFTRFLHELRKRRTDRHQIRRSHRHR